MKIGLLPSQQRTLHALGENIKNARLRRDLSAEQLAVQAGISRSTVINIEKGSEGVALGFYFRALIALGLEKDFLRIAKEDQVGRALQDEKITPRKCASKTKKEEAWGQNEFLLL